MKQIKKKILYFLIQWQSVLAAVFSLGVFIFLFVFFRYQLPGFVLARHEIARKMLEVYEFIYSYGIFSQFVFAAWYLISNIFFFPIFVLSLVGGLVFHPLYASLLAVVSLFFSLQFYYWMGRYFGPRFANRFGYKEEKLFEIDDFDLNFTFLLYCRLNFFIPIHALNAVSGAHKVPFFTYISSTLIGLSSRVIVYSLLGSALLASERHLFLTVCVWSAFVIVHSLFGYWHINSYLRKRLKQKDDGDHQNFNHLREEMNKMEVQSRTAVDSND